MSTDRYVSPLSERYASKEMQYIFSPDMKFRTWRRLWIALAETEKELGLNITQEQIDELKAHAEDINYDVAKERERQVRHDVMSHVYAYGVQCPKAKGIIHLGATSCYVGDNTDIIVMTEALKLVKKKLVNVIAELSAFADKYKDQPTLAFTHFQPAQPTGYFCPQSLHCRLSKSHSFPPKIYYTIRDRTVGTTIASTRMIAIIAVITLRFFGLNIPISLHLFNLCSGSQTHLSSHLSHERC